MVVTKQLNLLKKFIASQSTIGDAENLNKITNDKIAEFIEWASDTLLKESVLTEAQWIERAQKLGLTTAGDAYSAHRFVSLLLFAGPELSQPELEADLQALGFKKDKIDLIISTLQPTWDRISPVLKRRRPEALPVLWTLRWRVDVRYASNNYLKDPELVAILRIGTTDGTKRNHIHLEMDIERLSWLETEIVKLKNEMLKIQERTGAK